MKRHYESLHAKDPTEVMPCRPCLFSRAAWHEGSVAHVQDMVMEGVC